jgi:hypothetical protein
MIATISSSPASAALRKMNEADDHGGAPGGAAPYVIGRARSPCRASGSPCPLRDVSPTSWRLPPLHRAGAIALTCSCKARTQLRREDAKVWLFEIRIGSADPVSRTRCSVLHDAPQSRDRTRRGVSLRPRLCGAPLRAAPRPGNAHSSFFFPPIVFNFANTASTLRSSRCFSVGSNSGSLRAVVSEAGSRVAPP